MTRSTGLESASSRQTPRTRILLILDDPSLPEMENLPDEVKIAYMKRMTDADPSICRYAVINTELVNEPRTLYLLWLMAHITRDYHKEKE
jgi:hypothetical protein